MKRLSRISCTVLIMIMIATVFTGAVAFGASGPSIHGSAAIVYCATTDEVIWEKDSSEQYNLASITKLMTCLIAAEELGLDYIVTVSEEATQVKKYKSAVFAGEEISVENLIYEALLVSANDAAKALAVATAGSEDEFVVLMNERAREIGCKGTNFVTSSGVFEDGHCSTAKDVVLIAQEALANEDIARIAATAKYDLPATNKNEARELETSNLFLEGGEAEISATEKVAVEKYEGVFGGKTGTTNLNKTTMVVGCDFDGLEVYVSVLDSSPEQRYNDIKKLLDYAKDNLCRYDAFQAGDLFEEGSLLYGATNKIAGQAAETGIINLPEGASASLVTAVPVYNENLTAPITKGQVIGHIDICMADEVVRTIEMTASEDVKEGWFLSRWGITNLQTIIIIGALALILGLVITIIILRAVNKKKKAAARKERLRRLAMQQMENEHDHRQRNWPY